MRDRWVIWHPLGDVELRLTNSMTPATADPERAAELQRLERRLFAREPDVVRALQELHDAVHGGRSARLLAPGTNADEQRRLDELAAMLEREVHDGRVAIRSVATRRAVPTKQRTDAAAPKPPPAPAPATPSEEQVTFFQACFVDEVGDPIDGVEVVFSVAGKTQKKTTGGDGKARLDGVTSSFGSVRIADPSALRDKLKPRWDSARNKELVEPSEDLVVWRLSDASPNLELESEKLRTVSIRPYVVRARLLGGFFDTSKSFVLPNGIESVRGLVRWKTTHPETVLLAVGHTDTEGNPSYNDPLSLERAEAMIAYLTDDVDAWYRWYEASAPAAKRWGKREDLAMIDALPDAAERDVSENPVHWFQRTRGLTVDDIAGPETRHALIAEYMALDKTSLPKGGELTAHGCGENFPAEETGDGVADQENRRVEVFLFDRKLGIQPPPPGKNSAAGATEYPEWVKRSGKALDLSSDDDLVNLAIEWPEDVIDALPDNASVTLSGENVPPQKHFLAGAARLGGVARIAFGELKPTELVSLTAKDDDKELVLFRDQTVGDLDNPLVWEHELDELLFSDEPENEPLVATGSLPDDVEVDLVSREPLAVV